MSDKIKEILSKYKTIAMVGVSKDDKKPSTIVMKYMQKYGFKVIPVNPSAKGQKILGEEVFVDEAVYIRDTGESYWKVGLRQRKKETGHLYYKVTSTKEVSGLPAVKDG